MGIKFKFGKDKNETVQQQEPMPESRIMNSRAGEYLKQPEPIQQQQPQPPQQQQQQQQQPQQQQQLTPEQQILAQKYMDFIKENGVYNIDDFRNLFQAEICNLLFGIMQELKEINKKVR